MSQAHFRTCYHCPLPAVAVVRSQLGLDWQVCFDELNALLDAADHNPKFEPVDMAWVWDAGTRTCPIHHWPAVLCEGWNDEHHLVKRGTESYSDVARRLISPRSTT